VVREAEADGEGVPEISRMTPLAFVRTCLLAADRLRDAESELARVRADVAYWRSRYERLADDVLFSRAVITAPVHSEPRKAPELLGERVMRVGGMVGTTRPRPKDPDAPILTR
jgi:hypothetical protein